MYMIVYRRKSKDCLQYCHFIMDLWDSLNRNRDKIYKDHTPLHEAKKRKLMLQEYI